MTIQVLFLGQQGKNVPGKVGNLQSIDPVYEGNNILVGAVIHVIRPIDNLGAVCIPLDKFKVTYPLNAKFDETDGKEGRWSNFIPAELFKPSLEEMIWQFKNGVNNMFVIQGDFFGVESYSTETQRLNDANIVLTIQNQYLHEAVLKLRRITMNQGKDIWEAEVKAPLERTFRVMKDQADLHGRMAPRGYGMGRRGGRGRQDMYHDEFEGNELEGEHIEVEAQAPKKSKMDALKAFLPGGNK